MKKTIIGIALMISATLADIGILISASILGADLMEWETNAGKMWSALVENSLLFPFVLAKIVWVLAIVILSKEYFKKEK